MDLHKGATRWVITTKKQAYKIPSLHSWSHFLRGLLANMQESDFADMEHYDLCPVRWTIPGGWLVVMPYCEPITQLEYEVTDRETIDCILHPQGPEAPILPVEDKQSSFGWLGGRFGNGRIVAIDYGS